MPLAALLASVAMAPAQPASPTPHSTLTPIPFTSVALDDPFWSPRIDRIRNVTIPHNLDQCEATGRLTNFEAAARAMAICAGHLPADPANPPRSIGYFFNDSDVYKVIEGAANILAVTPDPELRPHEDA